MHLLSFVLRLKQTPGNEAIVCYQLKSLIIQQLCSTYESRSRGEDK